MDSSDIPVHIQQIETDSQSNFEQTQDPAEDPNPSPPKEKDDGMESSRNPTVNPDVSAVVDLPATPAADGNAATTPGERKQPTKETAIKSDESDEVYLNSADESEKTTGCCHQLRGGATPT
jgi:hypothetical protein